MYNVGDTWKCTIKNRAYAEVWLDSICDKIEFWKFSVCYKDGSYDLSDLDNGLSKRSCINQAIGRLYSKGMESNEKPRFKKIKEVKK
jgi:hypothetical protein